MAGNNLNDVFKNINSYREQHQTADKAPLAFPENDEPSLTPVKDSKFRQILDKLPFMNSPKRNIIYGIAGIVLAAGLVFAAFHAIVGPTAPRSQHQETRAGVVSSSESKKHHQKTDKKKTDTKKSKDDHKKKDDQKKAESKKPEQKKSEQKKQAPKKTESKKPEQKQASRPASGNRQQPASTNYQQNSTNHQQPARQNNPAPTQHRSQPANNGQNLNTDNGWSMNNGGNSTNDNGGSNSGSGTMSDGVYDGWDDDSRVGIYNSNGDLIN